MPPPPPTDLPTWEILPTADGHFQWAAAAGDPGVQPEPPLRTLARGVNSHPDHRLPSMADLSTLGFSLSIFRFRAWHVGSETFRCDVPSPSNLSSSEASGGWRWWPWRWREVSDVSDGNRESSFGEREFHQEGEVCSRRSGRYGHKWINKTWYAIIVFFYDGCKIILAVYLITNTGKVLWNNFVRGSEKNNEFI